MCVILAIQPRTQYKKDDCLLKKDFKLCWNDNSHGAGYMFYDGEKVIVKKGYCKFKPFYRSYVKDRNKYMESNFGVHFRKVSSGIQHKNYSHPFKINKTAALMHNGTIKALNTSKEKSDTYLLCKMVDLLPTKWYKDKTHQELVKKYVGKGRLLILTESGGFVTINKDIGVEKDGVWYSKEVIGLTKSPKSVVNNFSRTGVIL